MSRRTGRWRSVRWLALMLVLPLAACGEREPPAVAAPAAPASAPATENIVAAYLRGAEVQAENDAQRRELRRALADLIDKPDAELRGARYAGPEGPAQRDLVGLLRAHVVPAGPIGLDIDGLLAARGRPEARSAVREKLDELDRGLAGGASAPKQ